MIHNETPLVTVFIPAYNAAPYIGEAVHSVLAQDGVPFELVVMDDCSTDDTAARVAAFDDPGIRLIRLEQNVGVVNAANRALEYARGRYLARLDADDIMAPHRLSRQVAFLEAHPGVGACGGAIEIFGEGRAPQQVAFPQSDSAIRCAMLFGNPFAHSTVMLRMDLLRALRYDPDMTVAEDYDLLERMAQQAEVYNFPEVLCRYRRHANQLTEQKAQLMREKTGIVRRRCVQRVFPQLTTAQLELFDLVSDTAQPLTDEAYAAVEALLRGCVAHGVEHAGIRREDFERAVGLKWRNACHRTGGSGRALRRYSASPLRRLGPRMWRSDMALLGKWLRTAIFR